MLTRSQTTPTRKTVTLSRGSYGTLQPDVEIVMPRGTHFRSLRAEMLKLAAEVELATPKNEGGNVGMQPGSDTTGWEYLELIDGTDAEAARGMAIMKHVARKAQTLAPMRRTGRPLRLRSRSGRAGCESNPENRQGSRKGAPGEATRRV